MCVERTRKDASCDWLEIDECGKIKGVNFTR